MRTPAAGFPGCRFLPEAELAVWAFAPGFLAYTRSYLTTPANRVAVRNACLQGALRDTVREVRASGTAGTHFGRNPLESGRFWRLAQFGRLILHRLHQVPRVPP